MRARFALIAAGVVLCAFSTLVVVSIACGAVDGEWFGTGIWYEVAISKVGNHEFVLDLPIDIAGRVVWIFLWQDLGTMGAFEKGLLPVWYAEKADGAWIGGPGVWIGGTGYSQGEGKNGDGLGQAILEGGLFGNNGSIRLVDDGSLETDSRNQWTLEVYWPELSEIPDASRIVVIVQPNI